MAFDNWQGENPPPRHKIDFIYVGPQIQVQELEPQTDIVPMEKKKKLLNHTVASVRIQALEKIQIGNFSMCCFNDTLAILLLDRFCFAGSQVGTLSK